MEATMNSSEFTMDDLARACKIAQWANEDVAHTQKVLARARADEEAHSNTTPQPGEDWDFWWQIHDAKCQFEWDTKNDLRGSIEYAKQANREKIYLLNKLTITL